MVKRAAMQLRDPDERVQHEIWAVAPRRATEPEAIEPRPVRSWPAAPRAFGWRGR